MLFRSIFITNLCYSQDPNWKHQIEGEISAQLPGGDFKNLTELNTGFGGSLSYFYRVSNNLFVSASVGYYDFVLGLSKGTFNSIPLLIGLKYNLVTKGVQPYLGIEGGIYFFKSTINNVLYKDDSTRFGIVPKFGVRIPIEDGLDVDFSAKFHQMLNFDPSLNFFGINLGLSYTIDRIKKESNKK